MKKHFVTGLIILLPIAVTAAIAAFVMNFLTQPFMGLVKNILISYQVYPFNYWIFSGDQTIHYASQIIILILLFLVISLIGLLTRWFFINKLIALGDFILHRIPFINKLYITSKDIINTLFAQHSDSFRSVVMVPFPTQNIFCIGLVTKDSPPICRKSAEANLVSVFVPTTPNPTSGYLLMFKKEDIHYLDMKVEDAVKFIISCGVIYPDLSEEMKAAEAKMKK